MIGIIVGLSSGWVGENWRTFDSTADTRLCHVLDDRYWFRGDVAGRVGAGVLPSEDRIE